MYESVRGGLGDFEDFIDAMRRFLEYGGHGEQG
ncbi:MAG: hypothetical protein QW075_04670 [Thermofilaceae archaeon]